MTRQLSGLPSLSDSCWRAHTLPDPEAFFSTSWSISKQKFISSSSFSGLPFQALSPPGNSEVSVEGRTAPKKALNHCVALQQQPKETIKSKSSIQYRCSPSLLLQFIHRIQKKEHQVHFKWNTFFFFFSLKHTPKVFYRQIWNLLSIYPQKMNRVVHAQVTNLSLQWNWPRGDVLNTGRFLTPPHHSWRLT